MLTILGAILLVFLFWLCPLVVILAAIGYLIGGGIGAVIGTIISLAILNVWLEQV